MKEEQIRARPYKRFAIASTLVWKAGVAISPGWNLRSQVAMVLETARTAARPLVRILQGPHGLFWFRPIMFTGNRYGNPCRYFGWRIYES